MGPLLPALLACALLAACAGSGSSAGSPSAGLDPHSVVLRVETRQGIGFFGGPAPIVIYGDGRVMTRSASAGGAPGEQALVGPQVRRLTPEALDAVIEQALAAGVDRARTLPGPMSTSELQVPSMPEPHTFESGPGVKRMRRRSIRWECRSRAAPGSRIWSGNRWSGA